MATMLVALLPFFASLAAGAAVPVTRICQADSPYAPLFDDCRGALNNITKTYGSLGMVKNPGRFQSCEVIFSNNTCRIDLCAFPNQGLATANVVEAVGDLLGNCQGAGKQKVGGYDIIKNTNVTIGILGTNTPFQTTCTSTGPSNADCAAALNSISKSAPVKQPNGLGCAIVARSGTCAIDYCDAQGGQINGTVFRAYVDSLVSTCRDGSKIKEGWIDISPNRRIGVLIDPKSSPAATSTAPTCIKYNTTAASGGGGALQSDCDAAYKLLFSGDYENIKVAPFDSESQCSALISTGSCGFKLCGPPSSTALLKDVAAAYASLNKTCHASDGTLGGTVVVPNTSNKLKLALVSRQIPKNIFCNASPNNSPTIDKCKSLLRNINQTRIYDQRIGNAVDRGCSLVLSYQECKLNFCSSQTDSISGKDLYYAANSIFNACPAGDYVSGVYQINPYTKVSLYDPPDDPSVNYACQSGTWSQIPQPDGPNILDVCYQETSSNNVIGAGAAAGNDVVCSSTTSACDAMLGTQTTITKGYAVNVGIDLGGSEKGIDAGVSIGASYSWSIAKTTISGVTLKVDPGSTAHAVFYPYFHESCGALTAWAEECGADGCEGGPGASDPYVDNPNVCNRVPLTLSDGSARGVAQLCYTAGPRKGEGCDGAVPPPPPNDG